MKNEQTEEPKSNQARGQATAEGPREKTKRKLNMGTDGVLAYRIKINKTNEKKTHIFVDLFVIFMGFDMDPD